jgi:hypothetical protein
MKTLSAIVLALALFSMAAPAYAFDAKSFFAESTRNSY